METDNKPALAFAIIGNGLNLAYNIPFVYLVWKNRSSKNISGTFLLLRFWGSIAWLIYAVLVMDAWVGFSYVVTLTATCAIYYIKFGERNNKKREIKEAEAEPEVNEDLDAEPVFESVTRIDEIYKTTTI
jgi:uncharacterized protein with PQ loop repeat